MNKTATVVSMIFLVCLSALLFAQPYEGKKGDVNNDGSINVLDMVGIANHILGSVLLDASGLWRADVNGPEGNCDGDESANVLDMVKIANMILGNDECPDGTVTDIDGYVYKTVRIGDQVWMAENLRVTHYRNGDPIPSGSDGSSWTSPAETGLRCDYDNDPLNVPVYGRLYNWYAVNDERGIAPAGWHVPTDEEWQTLIDYLGGLSVAGDKLKEAGPAHWGDGNIYADNASGFTALPAGWRIGYNGYFYYLGERTIFWSSSEISSRKAGQWYLTNDYSGVYRGDEYQEFGFSVRCVRDEGFDY